MKMGLRFFLSIVLLGSFCLVSGKSFETADTTIQPNKKQITGLIIPARSTENGFYAQGGLMLVYKGGEGCTKNSNNYLFGLYSEKKQYRVSIGGEMFFLRNKLYVFNWSYLSYYPDNYFYLNNNQLLTRTQATSRFYHVESNVLYCRFSDIYAGFTVDFENNSFVSGDKVHINMKRFFDYTLWSAGILLRKDSRDQVLWPSSGSMLEFSYKPFFISHVSNVQSLLSIDYRYFRSVFYNVDNTLSTQVMFKASSKDLVNSYTPTVTGRAYHINQFRNTTVLNCAADYQIKLWRWLYPAIFSEIGITGIKGYEYLYSGGGGFRFKISKSKRLFIRLDYAVGQYNSSNVQLSFNNIF